MHCGRLRHCYTHIDISTFVQGHAAVSDVLQAKLAATTWFSVVLHLTDSFRLLCIDTVEGTTSGLPGANKLANEGPLALLHAKILVCCMTAPQRPEPRPLPATQPVHKHPLFSSGPRQRTSELCSVHIQAFSRHTNNTVTAIAASDCLWASLMPSWVHMHSATASSNGITPAGPAHDL